MAVDNKELAKYLRKEMETQDEVNTTFHLIKVPTQDDLEYWIQGFQSRKCVGHSEWSDRWQRNIWIPDEEEDMTVEPFLSYEDFKKEKGIDED